MKILEELENFCEIGSRVSVEVSTLFRYRPLPRDTNNSSHLCRNINAGGGEQPWVYQPQAADIPHDSFI
jgi:hypothetical protein